MNDGWESSPLFIYPGNIRVRICAADITPLSGAGGTSPLVPSSSSLCRVKRASSSAIMPDN
jgi:hypothetical protein